MVCSEEISRKRELLEAYARTRQVKIVSGEIEDSHLEGIANKASRLLESLVRALLEHYSSLCEINSRELAEVCEGKSLARMTLGDLVKCLRTFNDRLTRCLRGREECAEVLRERRLLTPGELTRFDEFLRLRKPISHDIPGTVVPLAHTQRCLELAQEILTFPVVQLGART